MKYLRGTLLLLVVTTAVAVWNVEAGSLNFQNIKIPAFKNNYISAQVKKTTTQAQSIKKTSCKDDWSGDGRVITARTRNMYGGDNYSEWIEVPYSYNTWGSSNREISYYTVHLQSDKWLASTATFNGTWVYN